MVFYVFFLTFAFVSQIFCMEETDGQFIERQMISYSKDCAALGCEDHYEVYTEQSPEVIAKMFILTGYSNMTSPGHRMQALKGIIKDYDVSVKIKDAIVKYDGADHKETLMTYYAIYTIKLWSWELSKESDICPLAVAILAKNVKSVALLLELSRGSAIHHLRVSDPVSVENTNNNYSFGINYEMMAILVKYTNCFSEYQKRALLSDCMRAYQAQRPYNIDFFKWILSDESVDVNYTMSMPKKALGNYGVPLLFMMYNYLPEAQRCATLKDMILHLMKRKNTNLNCSDSEGNTPLHLAYSINDQDILGYLNNEISVKKDQRNRRGLVPQDYQKQ